MQKLIGKIKDPLYSKQWNLRMMRVAEAWEHTQGEGVVVAILDTGVDGSHQDLGWPRTLSITATSGLQPVAYNGVMQKIRDGQHAKILPGENLVSGTDFTWDWNRHGTYLAGCIAAESDGFGMVGVAPLCKIRPYVVLDKDGHGKPETVANALVKAAEAGVDVICMSLAWSYSYAKVQTAVKHVHDNHNVIVVAASGNHNNAQLEYPARCEGVIAVGGANPTGNRWVHDKWKGANYGTGLVCAGPAAAQTTTKRMRSRFTAMVDATSMACANVVGVCALMRGMDAEITQQAATELLQVHSSNESWEPETGWGVPDAAKIVQSLAKTKPLDSIAGDMREIAHIINLQSLNLEQRANMVAELEAKESHG